MKLISLLILLTVLFQFGCSKSNQSNKAMERALPEFNSEGVPYFEKVKVTDCRSNIKKVLCLVDPVSEGEATHARNCLPGGKKYASDFEEIYDNYPEALQKMFCSLRVIYIENSYYATAAAWTTYNRDKKISGAMLKIRRTVIDERLTLAKWASWKEQLSFGGKTDSYEVTEGIPIVKTESNKSINDFLFFVVAHEFGHLFDFMNYLNWFVDCDENYANCEPMHGSWSNFSWETSSTPLAEQRFFNHEKLCFYLCEDEFIFPGDAPRLYAELFSEDSKFISSYAATNPSDDFAESLAFYILDKFLNSKYKIQTSNGEVYDAIEALHSKRFQEKYKYIDRLISNFEHIRYPGQ